MPDHDSTRETGYSREEEHFKNREMEWLRTRRAELDKSRAERAARGRKIAHWMKCPKCGSDLNEVSLEGVMVDRCVGCEGVFLDRGELEILLRANQGGGLLKKLFG